jgi:membrane protein involved in D-alanine export
MIPYADLLFFGLALYVLLPAVVLGMRSRLTARWVAAITLVMGIAQLALTFEGSMSVRVLHLALVAGFLLWQWVVVLALRRWRLRNLDARSGTWLAVLGCLLPLLLVKFLPDPGARGVLAFLGISYVSFRALDVVLAVHDGLATEVPFRRYFTFLFFFPTLSAGPIDRWQRFTRDLEATRSSSEYVAMLDAAVAALFQGLLYKFVGAVLVRRYWLDPAATLHGAWHTVNYMYAYSAYLFLDFAGYTAFAISFSLALGIRTPPNFRQPFLAVNIADFWTRWHISLSTFLRDHVYRRFLMANARRRWVRSRAGASAIGLLLTFGAMGLWHGTALRYVVYGLYHACIMIAYEWWGRRRKSREQPSIAGRAAATLLTVHAACFGFLVFSGRFF